MGTKVEYAFKPFALLRFDIASLFGKFVSSVGTKVEYAFKQFALLRSVFVRYFNCAIFSNSFDYAAARVAIQNATHTAARVADRVAIWTSASTPLR